MTLGNAIKLIRTARGFKQRELAKRLGKTANYLSLIESGKREPSVSFLKDLARELTVPVGVFFLWQDQEYTKLNSPDLREFRELMAKLQSIILKHEEK